MNVNDKQAIIIRLARVLRYNRNRIEKALTLFPMQHRPLFYAVPFLLHVNDPLLPGYVDDPDIPFGLAYFSYRKGVQEALANLFPNLEDLVENPKPIWPKSCYIESLSLMGSIGTTSQSDKSDLDFWVCVDGQVVNGRKWDLLQQKLSLIEQWVWKHHKLEVHFFLSDIEKVRNNDFGAADGESAGSAQPTFLKNEYYLTNILISGKIPFWWLTPHDCTDEQYQTLYQDMQKGSDPDPKYFMDLGNIERMEVREMFGASIWQLTKAMDSPFKSVLKMAKLEVYLDNTDTRAPLCNILKERVHRGVNMDADARSTDPYALMFDVIMAYYQEKQPKFLELFKVCMYVKSACPLSQQVYEEGEDFKHRVLREYVKQWRWPEEKVLKYDKIQRWEFQQVSRLGQKIHSFLIGCYRRLSSQMQGKEQYISKRDMTVFGRKIESFYSAKPGKIQYLKRAFETGLMQRHITITMELDLNFDSKQRWSAFRDRPNYPDCVRENPSYLMQSSDPVDLVLWCIFNQIIDKRSDFHFLQSKLPISVDNLYELITDALMDFKPIRMSDLSRKTLLAPCRITHCLMVANFSSHSSVMDVETVRVVYLTSWGELYSFSGLNAFADAKARFINQEKPPVCRLFTPARNNRRALYQLIEAQTDFQFDKVY